MTEQPGREIPVSKLQPLDFRLILDDGKAAVYQAVTVDREVPGVPVYTVTVTIGSDVRREAGGTAPGVPGRDESCLRAPTRAGAG
jgi:hypothetical protein